jgi:hypothetical protein
VFAADLSQAKGSAEKLSALAGILLEHATESPEPPVRYVLFAMATDAAVQAVDVAAAMKAAGELAKRFQVDAAAVRLDALKRLAHAARTPPQSAAVVEQLVALVEDRIAADDYAPAQEASRLAVEEAREGRDVAVRKRAVEQFRRTEEAAAAWAALQPSLGVLAQTPADPAANTAVGRFLCLVKGDWRRGLPLLARGNDPALGKLAQRELQEAQPGGGVPAAPKRNTLSLADAWWDLAEQEEGRPRAQLRAHAIACYRAALENLVGLDKARVQRRLAEAEPPAVAETPRTSARSHRRPAPASKILQAVYGKPKQGVDVTAAIQKALAKDPYLPIRVDMYLNGGIDPAPNQHKTLLLRYQFGRGMVERLLHEGSVETIPWIPPDGATLTEAADQFTVLAARYGAGVSWLDVTGSVSDLVTDPTVAFNFDPKKRVDDQARKACRALVVWFDYRGRRYVRVFEHTRRCLLLP